MKHTFFLFLLFLPLLAFSQKGKSAKKPTEPVKTGLPQSVAAYAYRDYNYTFYPDSQYRLYESVMVIDSASGKLVPKIDSTAKEYLATVVKEGSRFTINNLKDISTPYYTADLKFVGLTSDGSQSLVYESKTQTKEMVIVNPILGYVVIGFRACDKKAQKVADCDLSFHYFGRVPFKTYLP